MGALTVSREGSWLPPCCWLWSLVCTRVNSCVWVIVMRRRRGSKSGRGAIWVFREQVRRAVRVRARRRRARRHVVAGDVDWEPLAWLTRAVCRMSETWSSTWKSVVSDGAGSRRRGSANTLIWPPSGVVRREKALREVSAEDRRVVRRSAALGEGARGDRSGDFGGLAAGAGAEVGSLRR